MNTIIRTHGVVSLVVGWMLTGMGILAIATVIILSVFVEDWMIIFLFGPVLLFIGAAVNFWMGSRARLEITPDRFIWCGFIGRARSIAWHDVHRIVRPRQVHPHVWPRSRTSETAVSSRSQPSGNLLPGRRPISVTKTTGARSRP